MSGAARAIQLGSDLLQRRGTAGRVAGWLVDLTLVLVCGILLAKLFWSVMAPGSQVEMTGVQSTETAPRASSLSMIADPRVLQEFNPFDRDRVEAAVVEETTDAPETTLNLEIAGLWASSDPAGSFVRIRTPDDQVRRFRVGDSVVSGVTIDRILNDRVILVRNGQKEALLQREVRFLGTVQPEAPARPQPQAQPDPVIVEDEPDEAETEDVPSTLNVSVRSLDEFNSSLGVVRQRDSSGNARLVVGGSTEPAMMTKFSVEPGDVLLSVNGSLINADRLPELYESLQDQKVLTFVVVRNGRAFTRIVTIENGVGD